MKSFGIAALVMPLIAGCANTTIKQIPIVESSGSKSYVLIHPMLHGEVYRESATKQMKERANALCQSEYNLLNEEAYHVSSHPYATTHWPSMELVWQIKCKNQEQSKP